MPPFPFDVVFSLLRGPISIKALMGPMRLPALRNSALGFGLLISAPATDLTAGWIAPCLNDARTAVIWQRCYARSPSPI